MKKISITFIAAGLLLVSAIQAQSIQDGVKDLYAERYKSAKAAFEKLVASNPNNIEATYWLGQALIKMDDIAGAKNVYSKALLSSANAPLLIVGMGQVELKENKISEARQRFEAAITMSRGKKGDDPVILNAVGRAITESYNVKDKTGGDINYAIEKLEAAALRDQKNAEIFLNLGNAYRKGKPGEAGGLAFTNYRKAAEANPAFAAPHHRMAQLFYSQRNWELYEKYLNDAIAKDPKYAPAYYDLSYFKMGKLDFAAAEDFARKYSENADPDPSNEYLRASILYFQKKYDESINLAKSIISRAGDKPKPILYKLIAYNLVDKKDTAAAKPFVDDFFAKEKPEEITAMDYKLKADVYSAVSGQDELVYNVYLEAVKADTTVEGKVELLKQGASLFKKKGLREKEGDLWAMLVQTRPKLSINDLFEATRAYYFGLAYPKSLDMATKMIESFPNEVYGYEWKFNNLKVLDSTYKENKLVPAAIEYFEFTQKDTTKYKKPYLASAGFLLGYYANEAKDGAKALEYLNKMLLLDPTNEALLKIKPQLEKSAKQASPKSSSSNRSIKADSQGIKQKNNKEINAG